MGDGWMPLAYPPGEEARTAFASLHRYAEEAARSGTIGIDTRVLAGACAKSEWREEVLVWKSIGRDAPDLSQLLRKRLSTPHSRPLSQRPHRRDAPLLERRCRLL
jgi:alkanesulfonate monooxygenase SsuD/methylene tetrahydromethanopterin reductase-like flavin-dependent oxidoreductase (luciferase family)